MKLECLLFNTQILIKGTDDLDKWAHNEREESHARQHNADTYNFLKVCNGEQVTISDCRQSCNTEIARGDEPVDVCILWCI